MPDLGIPGTKTCTHPAPVFGCDGCIEADKWSFANKAYAEWKKTYKLPKCPECKKKMAHDGMFRNGGKFTALVVCMTLNADEGMSECGDQDVTVVIA